MSIPSDTIAAIRFGTGLSPATRTATSPAALLAEVTGPDRLAARYPIAGFTKALPAARDVALLRRDRRDGKPGAEAAYKTANRKALVQFADDFRHQIQRGIRAEIGFRERLTWFWADHFSVYAFGKNLRNLTTGYIEEAIRPNMTGKFRDLLIAAALHPVMLVYLDQPQSIGPNSPIGKKHDRGLNENLAREILELHSLGVGGAYTQTDVRQFAELLTGLGFNLRTGFRFRAQAAEPGAETVLGQTYGGRKKARLEDIHAALADIADHPDTARHIAWKLATHFVSDQPDPDLVGAMEAAFRDSDGDLATVYEAMFAHPAAWAKPGRKARQPLDFMVAALRAMDVSDARMTALRPKDLRDLLMNPLTAMGQPWLRAPGPDGWPEAMADWITPQTLAARIQWALLAAAEFAPRTDPRSFAKIALGPRADAAVQIAARAAESRREGVALVLASPEFNRR